MAIALKLSKSGYGSIKEIFDLSSEVVLAALDYDTFCNELEEQFIELNRQIK